jgi:hypothetical protein
VISHVLWFLVALPFFLLDGWLAAAVPRAPDLALALGLFCGLFARPAALPAILASAALARSVVAPGGLALHLLVLGIPVAVLVPVRLWLFRRRLLLQLAAAAFLAFAVPALALWLARFAGAGIAGDAGAGTLGRSASLPAVLAVLPLTWLLCALPPTRGFVERRE